MDKDKKEICDMRQGGVQVATAGLTTQKCNPIAHREGRTRSLKIFGTRDCRSRKSLTLYPIELGGHA